MHQGNFHSSDMFHPSPRLIDVTLPPELIPSSMAPPSPFFFTITKLSIQCQPVHPSFFIVRLFTLLSNMPVLEEFSFRSIDYLSPFPPQIGPPATPRLRSVTVLTPGMAMEVLCLLRAPCLSEVRIDTHMDFADTAERKLRAKYLRDCLRHLSRTAPSLTKLALYDGEFLEPHVEYPQLIHGELFPNLEYLVLCETNITNEILRECRPSGKLRRLELRACCVTDDGALPFLERCSKDFEFDHVAPSYPSRYVAHLSP